MIEKSNINDIHTNTSSVVQAQSKEGALYINVGHPLGYIDVDGTIMNSIDIGFCRVNIPQNDFRLWNTLYVKKYDNHMLKDLISQSLVLDLKYKEHRKKFLECVVYRQGFGCVYDKKHAVQLGFLPIHVTELQMTLWRVADGINTVEGIIHNLAIDEETLFENITILLKLDLIYIKYQI